LPLARLPAAELPLLPRLHLWRRTWRLLRLPALLDLSGLASLRGLAELASLPGYGPLLGSGGCLRLTGLLGLTWATSPLGRLAELAPLSRPDSLLLIIGGWLRLAGLLRLTWAISAPRRLAKLAPLSRCNFLLLCAGRRLLTGVLRLAWPTAALLGRLAELTALSRSAAVLGRVWSRLNVLLGALRRSAPLRLAHLPGRSLRRHLLRLPTKLPRRTLWRRALHALRRSSRLRAPRRTFLLLTTLLLLALLPGVVLSGAGLRKHDHVRSDGTIIGQARTRECNRRQHRAGEQNVTEILVHLGPCKVRTRRSVHVMEHRPELVTYRCIGAGVCCAGGGAD
jgi:hypothetical protein